MKNDNIKWCYHFPLYIFCDIIYVFIFRVLSFMFSFDVIIFHGKQILSFLCYHFPCTYFVLSFMLSFDVIIYCYHFPPFFFFLKTWHTPVATHFGQSIVMKVFKPKKGLGKGLRRCSAAAKSTCSICPSYKHSPPTHFYHWSIYSACD